VKKNFTKSATTSCGGARNRLSTLNFCTNSTASYHEVRKNSVLRRLRELGEGDRRVLIRFHDRLVAEGASDATISNYLYCLIEFRRMLGKPFAEATREDIERVVSTISTSETRRGKPPSEKSVVLFKITLKKFYKWLLGDGEEYPPCVRWLKTTTPKNNRLPRDSLLTDEDIEKLARAATNPRDRAIVLMLAESGVRAGELLSLRVGDVRFDQYGAIVTVHGKTGDRAVRLVASAPSLANWLEHHPRKDNPDAPVWVGTKGVLTYPGLHKIISRLARRAGIKKRVHPHGFRHTAATRLARLLTEAEMKQYFGWVQSSQMAGIYVHLASRDVDKALLRIHGLITEEKERGGKLTVTRCPRCGSSNGPGSKTCSKCGLPLTFEAARELDEREKVRRALLEKAKEMPEFEKLKDLIDALAEKLLAE